jgi:epoxyqueuosine reductase
LDFNPTIMKKKQRRPRVDSQTTWDKLKSDMKAAAAELGIDKIGIASVGPFTELKQRLLRHRELGYESGFEEPDLDKRTDRACSAVR